jgi:hypothetical protein
VPHPVTHLTQPRTHGAFTGGRYGSFAGRAQALVFGGRVTLRERRTLEIRDRPTLSLRERRTLEVRDR